MKMYSVINDALSLSSVENGNPGSWYMGNGTINNRNKTIETYILPFLKVEKSCKYNERENCIPSSVSAVDLSGEEYGSLSSAIGDSSATLYVLQDNSILSVDIGASGNTIVYQIYGVYFTFDTNGVKGPNTVGRDIFALFYRKDDNNKWYWKTSAIEGEIQCDTEFSDPYYCAVKLLLEGKMDY